jgi:hypothetical protein
LSAQPVQRIAEAEHVGRNCPYCRFTFKEGAQAVECGSCHALHHLECWQDNQGCAVLGCPSAPSAPGAAPPPGTSAGAAPPPFVAASAGPGAASQPAPAPRIADLADQVRSWLSTPVAIAIGEAALVALALMAVVALALAVVTPDRSLLGATGSGTGLFKELTRDIVAMTQARFGVSGFSFTWLPILFAVVPIVGAAIGVRRTAPRLVGLPERQRLLVAAATGVPLAVLLLVVSAFAGESDAGFSAASVIFYALLWGGIGGVAGLSSVTDGSILSADLGALPPVAARWLRIAGVAMKPLLALLLVGALVGVTAWEIQILRGQESSKLGRSDVAAIVETPFLAGEFAIQGVGLGALSQFRPLGSEGASGAALALPADDNRDLSAFNDDYRIFAYRHAYPAAIYVVLLIVLLGATLATMLFAGYSSAVSAGATAPLPAAGYGALAGVVWALAMALLRVIAGTDTLSGDSLFAAILVGGCAVGALGGLIATRRPAAEMDVPAEH